MKRDPTMNPSAGQQLAMFALLVAFGVAGRWLQPDWNVTPTAAVASFAAFWFARPLIAALAPLAVLAISNLLLDDYANAAMGLSVYLAFLAPVVLGRVLRNRFTWLRFSAVCVGPAVVFFVSTNFAHWAFLHQYPHTLAGLLECYAAAMPFFRGGTLPGDVAYTIGIFGVYAWAKNRAAVRQAVVDVVS